MNAKCTGCGIDSDKTDDYNKDNPVEQNGTYKDGKFVCDDCYIRLTRIGLDKGPAEHVQLRAAALLPPPPKSVDLGVGRAAVVASYSLEQAILDGVLVAVGTCGPVPIVFNVECFKSRGLGTEDKIPELTELLKKGLDALKKPDPEDSATRLRVLEEGKLWVIYDGLAITFLRPEDY
jgi:hypothetical protein